MNCIFISDAHITSRIPRSRIDNPLEAAKKKLLQVFTYADKHNACIVFAGDLFDTPRDIVALFAFLEIQSLFPKVKILAIYGQHDMYFRNKNVVTNLSILSKTGIVKILDEKGFILNQYNFIGCSWNEKIYKDNIDEDLRNVLVIHAPICDHELYPGASIIDAKKFQDENQEFDLIHCGDIHRRFYNGKNNTAIFNTGPLMRLSADNYMMWFEPCFYFHDFKRDIVIMKPIDHEPSENVLKKKITNDEEENTSFFKGVFNKTLNEFDILEIIEQLRLQHKNKKQINLILHEFKRPYK